MNFLSFILDNQNWNKLQQNDKKKLYIYYIYLQLAWDTYMYMLSIEQTKNQLIASVQLYIAGNWHYQSQHPYKWRCFFCDEANEVNLTSDQLRLKNHSKHTMYAGNTLFMMSQKQLVINQESYWHARLFHLIVLILCINYYHLSCVLNLEELLNKKSKRDGSLVTCISRFQSWCICICTLYVK